MFDHLGLKVRNLDASLRFYESALAPLGFELCCRDDASAGLGRAGAPVLWLMAASGEPASAAHFALRAEDHGAVDRFHAGGVSSGGSDHGAPGLRADYGTKYYAAFLIDPDGNNVEAVCTK